MCELLAICLFMSQADKTSYQLDKKYIAIISGHGTNGFLLASPTHVTYYNATFDKILWQIKTPNEDLVDIMAASASKDSFAISGSLINDKSYIFILSEKTGALLASHEIDEKGLLYLDLQLVPMAKHYYQSRMG